MKGWVGCALSWKWRLTRSHLEYGDDFSYRFIPTSVSDDYRNADVRVYKYD